MQQVIDSLRCIVSEISSGKGVLFHILRYKWVKLLIFLVVAFILLEKACENINKVCYSSHKSEQSINKLKRNATLHS